MQCSNGHENPEGSTFCNTCGVALQTESVSPNPTEQPRQSNKKRQLLLMAVGFAIPVLVAGAIIGALNLRDSGDDPTSERATDQAVEPTTFEVSGYVELTSSSVDVDGLEECGQVSFDCFAEPGTGCSGSDGFADLATGTQVSILDASGSTVALGYLDSGSITERASDIADAFKCQLSFSVSDVPDTGGIYSIEVGSRGGINFTKDEASSIALSIGG